MSCPVKSHRSAKAGTVCRARRALDFGPTDPAVAALIPGESSKREKGWCRPRYSHFLLNLNEYQFFTRPIFRGRFQRTFRRPAWWLRSDTVASRHTDLQDRCSSFTNALCNVVYSLIDLLPDKHDQSTKRAVLTHRQRVRLERNFRANRYLSTPVRMKLVQELGVPPKKIQVRSLVWYVWRHGTEGIWS